MDPASLIAQYGILAVFVGVLLEGETTLLLAGYAAHRGYLPLDAVLAAAWISATLGDQLYFWLGRRYGSRFANRYPRLGRRIVRAATLIERHPARVIFAMRFAFGLRIALPMATGMSVIPWHRFAVLNIAAAAFWTLIVTALGYAFGALLSVAIDRIERYEHWILLAIMAAVLVAHLIRQRRR